MAKKPALFGRCGSLIWTIAFCNLVKLKLTLLLIPYGNLKWQNLVFFSYCCSVNFHSVTMFFFPFNCVKPRWVVLPTWQLKVAKRAHFGCCWINFNLPLMFAGACNFFCRKFFICNFLKSNCFFYWCLPGTVLVTVLQFKEIFAGGSQRKFFLPF